MAGLQVEWALVCSGCLALRSAVPAPHVPGFPTSIWDEGVKLEYYFLSLPPFTRPRHHFEVSEITVPPNK